MNGNNANLGKQAQEKNQKNQGMISAGMDILSEAKRRLAWEEVQQEALSIEPEQMQIRKAIDQQLRHNQKEMLGRKGIIDEPGIDGVGNADVFKASLFKQLKEMNDRMYDAIQMEDDEEQEMLKTKLATLKTNMDRFREETQQFFEDHFSPDNFLSKSCSQQQLSYGTQIYCKNPDIKMVHATKTDVLQGERDAYGKPVVEDQCYAIVQNMKGEFVMVDVIQGNKDMYLVDITKAMEYLGYIQKYSDQAAQARQSKNVTKIDLGAINYNIDQFFGSNDGTANKTQDRLVLQFAWDTHLLKDGSSFRRHLYEHPKIENLNYGEFDFESMEFSAPLGPGDENYWYDNIDGQDKLRMVDAICNQDNPFFDIKLLRTLVKEYYTYRIENTWWKSMGYDEGRLEIMRLKQNELRAQRFKMAKAEAAQKGQEQFTFDGKIMETGINVEKQRKEQEENIRDKNPKPITPIQ